MSDAEPKPNGERCVTCGRDAQVHPFHSFLDFRSAAEKTKAGSRSARETADMAPPNPERDYAGMRDGDTPHASASNRADPNPPPAEPTAAEPPKCGCGCESTEGDCVGYLPWPERGWPRSARRMVGRLRSEVEQLVAALNREHNEVAGYRELLKLPLSPKETCPTCALVDEARRTIGGEDGA